MSGWPCFTNKLSTRKIIAVVTELIFGRSCCACFAWILTADVLTADVLAADKSQLGKSRAPV